MSDADNVNILVVDDCPEQLLVFQRVLAELEQNVVTARSGREALRQTLEHDFAVILLDVNLPDMDGFETAELIRRQNEAALTPIILLSGVADETLMARAYSLGAVDYLLSPVVPDVLRTKVRIFVELFQQNQQVQRQANERIARAQAQAARSAAEKAARRSQFLLEASKALNSALDIHTTLRSLARLVVPFLADLGAVTAVNEQGDAGPTEIAWLGPNGEPLTQTVASLECLPAAWVRAAHQVLRAGKTERLSDLGTWLPGPPPSDPLENGRSDRRRPAVALQTAVLLPLSARGRTLGLLTLACGPSGRRYDGDDVALADDLANRAAIAVDNARLYQRIQEDDRRKNEFLAMLAHELRNPLAPIRNGVEIMRFYGPQEPRLKQIRDMIERQVLHMARLVDDLLDSSRIAGGKIPLRKMPLDLVDLIQTTVEDHRPDLEAAGLTMEVHLPTEPMPMAGDPTRLSQVIGNLLHNANKFTDAGGKVLIQAARDAGTNTASITIRDTGIGIEPAMLEHLFESFSQADRSLDRGRGGLGLGLALVKGLVELHGGTVRAHSEGLGQGTEVTIQLPLESQAPAQAEAAGSADLGNRVRRVLLIEDDLDAAESMRILLSLSGHQVEVATTGQAGVAAARDFRPDVVLCDIGLVGGMDGYAVARALQRERPSGQPYLIAVTGYGHDEDQQRAREAGFDLHLTKPIDPAKLESVLATIPPSPRA